MFVCTSLGMLLYMLTISACLPDAPFTGEASSDARTEDAAIVRPDAASTEPDARMLVCSGEGYESVPSNYELETSSAVESCNVTSIAPSPCMGKALSCFCLTPICHSAYRISIAPTNAFLLSGYFRYTSTDKQSVGILSFSGMIEYLTVTVVGGTDLGLWDRREGEIIRVDSILRADRWIPISVSIRRSDTMLDVSIDIDYKTVLTYYREVKDSDKFGSIVIGISSSANWESPAYVYWDNVLIENL